MWLLLSCAPKVWDVFGSFGVFWGWLVAAPAEGEAEEMAQMAQLLGQMGGGAGGLPPGVVQVGHLGIVLFEETGRQGRLQ
jgi:hypothetical protein